MFSFQTRDQTHTPLTTGPPEKSLVQQVLTNILLLNYGHGQEIEHLQKGGRKEEIEVLHHPKNILTPLWSRALPPLTQANPHLISITVALCSCSGISYKWIYTACSLLYLALCPLHNVFEIHLVYWIWIPTYLWGVWNWTNYLTSAFSAEKWSYSYLSDRLVMLIIIKVSGLVLYNQYGYKLYTYIYMIVYFSFTPSTKGRKG